MGEEKQDSQERKPEEVTTRVEAQPTPLDRGTDIAVKALLRRR
jgi:hypothetical protein